MFDLFDSIQADGLIEAWALEHGYVILTKNRTWANIGPFFTTDSQLVYHVQLLDQGQLRLCWIRVGNWVWGTLSNELTVEWQ